MVLAYLGSPPSHNLVIWIDGFVSFSFGNKGFVVLANCSLCGAETIFLTLQAKYTRAFLLKPATFCKLPAGLGRTNKSATFLLFSNCCFVIVTLSSRPFFFLSCTLFQIMQELSFVSFYVSIRLQWVSDDLFLPSNGTANELVRQVDYSGHPLSYVVFLFLLLILLFFFVLEAYSLIKVLLHTNFSQYPLRNLCVLITLVVFSFVNRVTEATFCSTSIYLELKILRAAPAVTRPRPPLISICIVSCYGLDAPLAF